MATTVKSLEERMDDFERSFDEFKAQYASYREMMADFRGRVDVVITVLRWASALMVVTLISIVFQAISISNAAGRLEGRVEAQGKQIEQLVEAIKAQQQDVSRLRADIAELKAIVKPKP